MRYRPFIKPLIITVIILMNVGCDQYSKRMVRAQVEPREHIKVLDEYLILTNVGNTGAMLGFGKDFSPALKVILLQILPVLVLLAMLLRIIGNEQLGTFTIVAFACVIGGGMGNLMDRIFQGYVTDFFQIRLGPIKTGIFNLADVSVTLGTLFIIMLTIKHKKIPF